MPELFTEPLPGEISAEEAKRLGIKEWRLSPEAEAEIRNIEEHIALSAAAARSLIFD